MTGSAGRMCFGGNPRPPYRKPGRRESAKLSSPSMLMRQSDTVDTHRSAEAVTGALAPGTGMDISVVLSCYTEERWGSICAALNSLTSQSLAPRAVIVAVDNNPRLAARLTDEFDWLTVILNSGDRGASATRNCGAAAVNSSYTAFLDDDEVAHSDWLYELSGPLAAPGVVGVGGRYEPRWVNAKPAWFPDEFGWAIGGAYQGMPTITTPVRNVWSGNMAVRTEALRQVGGFRPGFGKRGEVPQPEDTDFCIRAANATGALWMYVPSAVVFHHVPPSRESLSFFASRCYAEGAGKAMLQRHIDSGAIDVERRYVRTTAVAAVRRLFEFRRPAVDQSLAILLGLGCAGAGYVRGLSARSRS
jgi:GT2 family glycosyltransferase